jgi:hypothetical protein
MHAFLYAVPELFVEEVLQEPYCRPLGDHSCLRGACTMGTHVIVQHSLQSVQDGSHKEHSRS